MADTHTGLPPLHLGDMKRERFSVIEEGKIVGGVNLEIFEELARRLNIETRHSYCPFKRCLTKIARHEIDMMMWIIKTPDRDRYLEYVQLWPSPVNIRFYTRAGESEKLNTYSDLQGLSVGAIRGFYYTRQFDSDETIDKHRVNTEELLPKMLIANRIDAFPVYGNSHVHIEKEFPSLEMAPLEIPSRDMAVMVFSKQSPYVAMIPEINATLIEMLKDGTLDRIWATYHPNQKIPAPESMRNESRKDEPSGQ